MIHQDEVKEAGTDQLAKFCAQPFDRTEYKCEIAFFQVEDGSRYHQLPAWTQSTVFSSCHSFDLRPAFKAGALQ